MNARRTMLMACCVAGLATVALAQSSPAEKLHPSLFHPGADFDARGHVKAWVFFTDKGHRSSRAKATAIRALEGDYNKRAIKRRQSRRSRPNLFDETDLPVVREYIEAVENVGASARHSSRWLNSVSVLASRDQLLEIARLDFVEKVQPVRRGWKISPKSIQEDRPVQKSSNTSHLSRGTLNYGESLEQLTQINLVALHDLGYTGNGIVIGVLDTGFQRSHAAFNNPLHPLTVVAEYDFVDDDSNTAIEVGDPSDQHAHGTYILGTLGAFLPGELVGAAYDASFILCKTEDTTAEYQGEEDNFVAGLEFIEANGGDVITSSLRYSDWYTQEDMDGLTGVTTIAVNIATGNGLHMCNSAGNSGHDSDPATSTLGAPADAFDVLSCGAVNHTGAIASFSTDGPTADGRVKPEVLARGINTRTVSAISDTSYAGVGGTSLSTPLIAGAIACLTQAHPTWNVTKMRQQLMETSLDFVANGTFDPLYVRGYGIIDSLAAAIDADCNGNEVDDAVDIDQGTSQDANGNGIPDECEPPIPTVSQWGWAAMVLSFLCAATVILSRRVRPSI